MKQILIVEDDSFLNKMLAYNLTAWQCCEIHKGRRKDYFGYQQLPRSG